MKFTCTQENLNRGLLIVSNIANRSATLPILNNVLVETGDGIIKLSTTNLEMAISATIRGKVSNKGQFTVRAKLFSDYVNLLPNENVETEQDDQNLSIKCKKHETTIKGVDASEFPLIPEIEKKDPLVLKSQNLKKALARVLFAVGVDESRPEISGVLFLIKGNELTIVGTDSYRLAENKVILDKNSNLDKKIIVPLRTLQEVYRILSEIGDKGVEIFVDDNQILFKLNDEIELTSRLVEGQYPDYEQIIPSDQKTKTKVKVAEFVRVIKSAALFCKPGINDVKISFLSDKNEIVVSSLNSSVGENLISLEAEVTGEDNEVVFNYRYLLDGLSNLGSAEAEIEIISNNAPGIIKPLEDASYLYIIMPIRQ